MGGGSTGSPCLGCPGLAHCCQGGWDPGCLERLLLGVRPVKGEAGGSRLDSRPWPLCSGGAQIPLTAAWIPSGPGISKGGIGLPPGRAA